ncbi:hypothetical protein BaRGS_00005057 [Batillaria attramentaria]|uniref:Uncharacterized protein n=1 Tax=Batillaria attramentaria TaxID=370345 RepID=A0ABD0LWC1_9CAEN
MSSSVPLKKTSSVDSRGIPLLPSNQRSSTHRATDLSSLQLEPSSDKSATQDSVTDHERSLAPRPSTSGALGAGEHLKHGEPGVPPGSDMPGSTSPEHDISLEGASRPSRHQPFASHLRESLIPTGVDASSKLPVPASQDTRRQLEPPPSHLPIFKFYSSNFDAEDMYGRVTGITVGFRRASWEQDGGGDQAHKESETDREILAMGGLRDSEHKDGISHAHRYSPTKHSWEQFSDMPETRLNFGVAYLKNCIYVVGGYEPKAAKKGIRATRSTFRFDPVIQSWETVGEMKTARSFHSVCCLRDRLYAIGGQDDCDSVLNSAEVFDLSSDKWSPVASMSCGRVGASCVSFKDQIMITGGYGEAACDGAQCPVLLSTEWFDPSTNRWTRKSELRVPRAQACMVVVDDCVYLCGGAYRDPFTGALCSMADVDKYDPVTEEWEHLTDLHTARHNAGATVIDGKIYIVGGVSTNTNQVIRSVECYDTKSGKWDLTVPDLPRGAKSLSCVVIPQDILW